MSLKNLAFLVTGAALVAAASAQGQDNSKIQLLPLKTGASMYFGQMFNISEYYQDTHNFNPTVTLPSTSLWMVQEAAANERLHFSLGIAGTFWYPFPEDNKEGYTSYRTGGLAISQAVGTYTVGDVKAPWMLISVGQQNYKYNPYAKNFGEYIFRSEAYPTTVRTGDWGAIDNAGAGIWGAAFKGSFFGGRLKNDFLITMANERLPLHDVSFTNITRFDAGMGFQFGGGVKLSRFLQFDPQKSKPRLNETGWFTWTAADQAWLDADTNATGITRTTVVGGSAVTAPDTALMVGQDYWAASARPLVQYVVENRKRNDLEYVDTKAIILMAQASFDPKPILGLTDLFSPYDLTLYGEVSVLGTKNYPIYYKSVSERTPVMVGFYLPTFRQLDYLTVEMEYFKNPHMNSDYIPAWFRAPRPKSPDGVQPEIPDIADAYHDAVSSQSQYGAHHHDDDFKWTVTAQKSFNPWSIAFQVGKDHYRPLTGSFRPSYTEAATTSDAWYYMLRLMVNL